MSSLSAVLAGAESKSSEATLQKKCWLHDVVQAVTSVTMKAAELAKHDPYGGECQAR